MPRKDPERIEESEINKVVVCIMADHGTGRMKVKEIRAELPHYARLSSKDETDSETRHREHLWEQQVRNLNLMKIVLVIFLVKVMSSGLEEEFGR